MSTQFTNRQWRLPNEENKSKVSNYSIKSPSTNARINISSPANVGITSSFAFWLKRTSSTAITQPYRISTGGVLYGMYMNATTAIYVRYGGSPITINNTATLNALALTDWVHWVITREEVTSTTQDIKLYANGSLIYTLNGTSTLGTYDSEIDYLMWSLQTTDFMDSFSIFNYALSSSQITTLYGSSSTGIGNPMSLSPKPVAFYQLGDKSAFNSANYLVPNIAAQEADGDIAASYSPYALDFDSASSDYIDCGNDSSLNLTSEISLSAWVKTTDQDSTNNIIKKDDGTGNRSWNLSWRGSSGGGSRLVFWNWSSDGSYNYIYTTGTPASNFADGNWHHVVVTYNGTTDTNGAKIYLDGVLMSQGAISRTGTGLDTTTANVTIGNDLTASISNASMWNAALTQAQVTEIYNEGVPSNLNNHSAYSNLVSWWQLGSNTSWVNPYWIALDEKGTNNGQSQNIAAPNNMGENAIVDGVGSYANGVGTSSLEVIGDAPYSTANALSVNMDVEDRVTDTPS